MKYLIFLMFCILLFSCSNNKSVYWCGDHACINKKEKEAFFKKTMIVEKRELNEKNKLSKSEKNKILKQIRLEKKERKELARQVRLEEKEIIDVNKEQTQQVRLEKKQETNDMYSLENRIKLRKSYKEQKKLKKQARLEKKNNSNEKKNITKKKTFNTESASLEQNETFSTFNELVEKITKKNMLRPYPNINDIPN